MSEIKWIKITTDIFENRKIRQIESLPDGDAIIVIWLKLLTLAGSINDQGQIYFTQEIPYTEEMMATQFNRPLSTVKLALKVFVEFGMIDIVDDILKISNWEKYQNVDGLDRIREQTRKRVAKHREKQKMLEVREIGENEQSVTLCNVTDCYTVTHCNATEEEEDIDKDKEKEKYKKKNAKATATADACCSTPKKTKHKHGEYNNVLLTDEEFKKLAEEFPDLPQRIDNLSGYIASTGKTYKSHYATIRNWARKEKEAGEPVIKENGFANFDQRTYDDNLEQILLSRRK